MLEFVFFAIFFFTFLICSLELIRMSYVKLALQFVATSTLRAAVVGPSDTVRSRVSANAGLNLWEEAAREIENDIISRANDLWVTVEHNDISICPLGSACTTNTTGGPMKPIMISIERPIHLFFGGFGKWRRFTLSTLVIGRNEPFDDA